MNCLHAYVSHSLTQLCRSKMLFNSIAPGGLESVDYEPDIFSVLLKWDPPVRGRSYITMVTLEYYNNGSSVKLGTVNVTKAETNLMEENTKYRFRHMACLHSRKRVCTYVGANTKYTGRGTQCIHYVGGVQRELGHRWAS